ncbi:26207_t:CDS:1, partial [Gigaspora margarita]
SMPPPRPHSSLSTRRDFEDSSQSRPTSLYDSNSCKACCEGVVVKAFSCEGIVVKALL